MRRVASAPACHYSLTADSNFLFAAHPGAARACGCWAAARDTASSTVPRWPSTWPPCWAAARRPEPRFALGERRPGRSLRTAGSAPAVSERRRLLPLVLATAATQASIVVLAPLLVEIGREFDASLGEVGLARSVLAGTAVAVSLVIGPVIDRWGVGPLIAAGRRPRNARRRPGGRGSLARRGSTSPGLVTGAGVACTLSAGFAGVASYFSGDRVEWAMGWVVGLAGGRLDRGHAR